jgi:hypothetical protein
MRLLCAALLCAVVWVAPPESKNPHVVDDDCVPTAVVTHPSGAVFGEEDCQGEKQYTKLSP